MDFDGDGNLDILSGSYWPGDLFIFKGRADGTFAKGTQILDERGGKLSGGSPWKDERTPDMDALASVPFAVDYDGDGDLDLLIGNIAGRVMLVRNEGSATDPSFSATKKQALEAGGAVVTVPGGDSGPVMADWDGDGRLDLIVGAGDGSVLHYRDTASAGEPVFAAAEVLVGAPANARGLPVGTMPVRPGLRAKVCVTDWNDDGRLDLLVGDFVMQAKPEPKLNGEQLAKREKLQAQERQLTQQLTELYEEIDADAGGAPVDIMQDPRYVKLVDHLQAVSIDLQPLQGGQDLHGWVWCYVRKPL